MPHPLQNLFVSAEDLKDKDKADNFVRLVAVAQISWLIIEVAVRQSTGLPITQLEVGTLSLSVMAVAIYAANWWKPKDVGEPTKLNGRFTSSSPYDAVLQPYHTTYRLTDRFLTPRAEIDRAWKEPTELERIRNDTVFFKGRDSPIWISLGAASLVFGGLHCLAWNYEFPSNTELVAWRTTSLAITVLPAIALVLNYYVNWLLTEDRDKICRDQILQDLKRIEPKALDILGDVDKYQLHPEKDYVNKLKKEAKDALRKNLEDIGDDGVDKVESSQRKLERKRKGAKKAHKQKVKDIEEEWKKIPQDLKDKIATRVEKFHNIRSLIWRSSYRANPRKSFSTEWTASSSR